MQKSPVKFDDLAFILLFFFMIIAVVSFGQMAEKVQTQSEAEAQETQQKESVPVFLNADGTLSINGRTVEPSFFDNSLNTVELSCSPDATWAIIQNTVNSLNCEVVLVI